VLLMRHKRGFFRSVEVGESMKKVRIKPVSKTIRDDRGRSVGSVRINSRGGVKIRTKPPRF
jgi:hypothetical protein